jgi:hypothetical protein
MSARLRTAALVNLAMVVEQANEQVWQQQQQQQQHVAIRVQPRSTSTCIGCVAGPFVAAFNTQCPPAEAAPALDALTVLLLRAWLY